MGNAEKIIIREAAKPLLTKVEVIVFDIDGVLIDSSKSFRKTIAEAVQFYFENILKYKGEEQLVRQSEIQLFKDAGGFNNDWELTTSLCLFYLCKSLLLDSRELAVLRYQEPYLDASVVAGVKDYQNNCLELLEEQEQQQALGLWNKPLIIQIFQELYAGVKFCQSYYGFEPVYVQGTGNIESEVSLLDNSLLSKPVAVITGRSPSETKGALKLTGLDVNCEVVICDNGENKTKPHPQSLVNISDKMNIKTGLYVGDAMDDFLLVENFNKLSNEKLFLSAMLTSTPEKYEKADIVASNVNEVLKAVVSC